MSAREVTVRAVLAMLVMAGASALALAITPHRYLADEIPRERLAQIVPRAFGQWEVDRSIVPVPPAPDVQAQLDIFYDETLALTYRNARGERIMLSLAYGRNQHKGMNTHRPEVCYPAQGFTLTTASRADTVDVDGIQIPVTRLVATLGQRNEPITYWLLLGEEITYFGYPQRLATIRSGLLGLIPDGLLVRVSSVGSDNASGFALQELFIRDFVRSIDRGRQPRLLGKLARDPAQP